MRLPARLSQTAESPSSTPTPLPPTPTNTPLPPEDSPEGIVAGYGWIHSPVGAYAADPALEGRAAFAFLSWYREGSQTPSGATRFTFRAGNMAFRSNVHEGLVVAGHKAAYGGVDRRRENDPAHCWSASSLP